MPEDSAKYLESGSGMTPDDGPRLDLIRQILSDDSVWSEPPAEVEEAVVATITSETQHPAERPAGFRRRWPWVAGLAAAGAAVVLLILGLVGTFGQQPVELQVALEGTELEADAVGEALLRQNDSGWWIRLEVTGLSAAPEGTYYEGWVWSDEGDGVSIGTFHLRQGTEPVILWSGVDPADYPSIWVTLEDEDGDPSASERLVMLGRVADTD